MRQRVAAGVTEPQQRCVWLSISGDGSVALRVVGVGGRSWAEVDRTQHLSSALRRTSKTAALHRNALPRPRVDVWVGVRGRQGLGIDARFTKRWTGQECLWGRLRRHLQTKGARGIRTLRCAAAHSSNDCSACSTRIERERERGRSRGRERDRGTSTASGGRTALVIDKSNSTSVKVALFSGTRLTITGHPRLPLLG